MLMDGVRSQLLEDSTVVAAGGGRVYPLVLPESGNFPATTYKQISERGTPILDGHCDFTRTRLQFDHWGEVYGDCRSLAMAVDAVLEDFAGVLPDGTYVYAVSVEAGFDRYEQEAKLYRFSRDYMFMYSR